MPVTITQIAERAGISPGTVSRVLNRRIKENRPAIAKRAERIRAIAAEMGYRTNHAARSMATGRFGQVAFVTCGEMGFDWFAPPLLHGIHSGLESINARLVMHEMPAEAFDNEQEVPRFFKESSVDGLLLNIDAKISSRLIQRFDDHPVPAVLLNEKRNTRCVYPGEFAGGQTAARHLIDAGYKRIGFLMLDGDAGHFSVRDRVAGVNDAIAEAGLEPGQQLLGVPGFKRGDGTGVRLVTNFLRQAGDVEAVICYSATDATLLTIAAERLGRHVPDDLHLLVFHYKVFHAETGVPIDTMIVPFREVGAQGVHTLETIIEGGSDRRPEAVEVPYAKLFDANRRGPVMLADK